MQMIKRDFALLHKLLAEVIADEIQAPVALPAVVEAALQDAASGQNVEEQAAPELVNWLSLLDLCATPRLLRTGIEQRKPAEEAMVALVRFLCAKPVRNETDPDRTEWVLTYIFKERRTRLGSIGNVHDQVVALLARKEGPDQKASTENLLAELASLLDEITSFQTFEVLTKSGVIARGREIKQGFKEDFFHPEVLATIVNYNLIFSKKFDQLFQAVRVQAKEVAGELARRDYRYTSGDFKALSGATPGAPRPGPATANVPTQAAEAPGEKPDELLDRIRSMGVNPEEERRKLRNLLGTMTSFVQATTGRAIAEIPLPHSQLFVTPWEERALSVEYPASDKTFRAEVNRALRTAIGLLASISEERAGYMTERRGSEHRWKKHYDALLWLLYEARAHREELARLADKTEQTGLTERAEQIRKTAKRLEDAADQVTGFIRTVGE